MAKKKDEIQHSLIPKHEKLSEAEKKRILEQFKATNDDLPKILISDPAIRHIDIKPGDVIKITRNSPTAVKYVYYRGVVSD